MLDRSTIERLRLLPERLRDRAKASQMKGDHSPAWCDGVRFAANQIESAEIEELCRGYLAVLDAPEATPAEVIALAGGNHWHAKIVLLGPTAKALGGQRVRIVPVENPK